MASGKNRLAGKSQSKRFIDAAPELGCDESGERFDKALRAVAKHKKITLKPSKKGQRTDPIAPSQGLGL